MQQNRRPLATRSVQHPSGQVTQALERHRLQALTEVRSITARLQNAHALSFESLVALTQRRQALMEVLALLAARLDGAPAGAALPLPAAGSSS
ncbi:MAG: hypothetical protein KatS3mg131_2441 [Candidatus Tectimicrobiota bacterium]|nr:MAG: hypothetical protein KatS3mg131_2441 [Candidatus Tectomicrobia bacterium]